MQSCTFTKSLLESESHSHPTSHISVSATGRISIDCYIHSGFLNLGIKLSGIGHSINCSIQIYSDLTATRNSNKNYNNIPTTVTNVKILFAKSHVLLERTHCEECIIRQFCHRMYLHKLCWLYDYYLVYVLTHVHD
jgi:hypothetical protein